MKSLIAVYAKFVPKLLPNARRNIAAPYFTFRRAIRLKLMYRPKCCEN